MLQTDWWTPEPVSDSAKVTPRALDTHGESITWMLPPSEKIEAIDKLLIRRVLVLNVRLFLCLVAAMLVEPARGGEEHDDTTVCFTRAARGGEELGGTTVCVTRVLTGVSA